MSWFGLSYPFRYRVIVNLKNQTRAFRGVLWQETGGWLVLKHAEVLEDRSAPKPVDGEVLIERRDVDFIQVPPGVREP